MGRWGDKEMGRWGEGETRRRRQITILLLATRYSLLLTSTS
ncbi:MAG: hypothetical protein WBA39_34595 [Rivularia sp. (in: cyanobacteria)]